MKINHLPLAAEVERSSQADQQQNHTENDEDYLSFLQQPPVQLWAVTPGAVEAHLTPATQTEAW